MTLSTRCRALAFLALLLLLGGLPGRSYAMYDVEDVSKESAKQLGITMRSQPRPEDVWVQVEFKSTGRLKEFRWADLELTQGGKRLIMAALMPWKPTPDSVWVEFYIDPASLPNATVTIFVSDQPLGGTGYRLQMKGFLPTRSKGKGSVR
jgi:hypothetical protein